MDPNRLHTWPHSTLASLLLFASFSILLLGLLVPSSSFAVGLPIPFVVVAAADVLKWGCDDVLCVGRRTMEPDVLSSEMVLPAVLPFKRVQMSDKYPKGQSRGRHWKHLKQILQAENYVSLPVDEPNYLNIEAPPSMYPSKKYCDITGFEAPYVDPRTSLRYANPGVFKRIRGLPDDQIQKYLALRNAVIVLR